MAYDTQKNMVIPEGFLQAVQANEVAAATYATLNKSHLFRIGYNLQTAKRPETRQRRFDAFITKLSKGEKPE